MLQASYNYQYFPDGQIQVVGNAAGSIATGVILNGLSDISYATLVSQLAATTTLFQNDKVFIFNSSTLTANNLSIQMSAAVGSDRWGLGGATESVSTLTLVNYTGTGNTNAAAWVQPVSPTNLIISSSVGTDVTAGSVVGADNTTSPPTFRSVSFTMAAGTATIATNFSVVYKVVFTTVTTSTATITLKTTPGNVVIVAVSGTGAGNAALSTTAPLSAPLLPSAVMFFGNLANAAGAPIWITRQVFGGAGTAPNNVVTPPASGLFESFLVGHIP